MQGICRSSGCAAPQGVEDKMTDTVGFIPWIGGKTHQSRHLVKILPKHKHYCEVFGGSGALLFRKKPAFAETYNDLNGELVNLFRVVKENLEEFLTENRWNLVSREMFEEYKAIYPRELDGIQRAVRFFYLIIASNNCNMDQFKQNGFRPASLHREKRLRAAHDRLKKVIIENQDFEQILPRFDREDTLYYLDPPYMETGRKRYVHTFKKKDHVRLAEALYEVKHAKWLLSYDDRPQIRELYSNYTIEETKIVYSSFSLPGGKRREVTELVISNYRPKQNVLEMV